MREAQCIGKPCVRHLVEKIRCAFHVARQENKGLGVALEYIGEIERRCVLARFFQEPLEQRSAARESFEEKTELVGKV